MVSDGNFLAQYVNFVGGNSFNGWRNVREETSEIVLHLFSEAVKCLIRDVLLFFLQTALIGMSKVNVISPEYRNKV